MFSSVGSRNSLDSNFDFVFDEFKSPEVNHGSLFIYFDLIFMTFSGNDSSNASKYSSKNVL